MKRIAFLFLLSLMVGGSVSACGDDSPSSGNNVTNGDGDGDGDGDSDAGGDGDGDSDAGGDGDGDGDGDADQQTFDEGCGPTEADYPGTCTAADYAPYAECVNDACEEASSMCADTCSDYLDCLVACDCDDVACIQDCTPSEACVQCNVDHPCEPDCEMPACASEVQAHTCAELAECCAELEGEIKTACEQLVASSQEDPDTAGAACSAAFPGFGAASDAPECD